MEIFTLSSNNIKKLPEELGECKNLKELYINNNAKLTTVPPSLGHLINLNSLELRKCVALKTLPNSGIYIYISLFMLNKNNYSNWIGIIKIFGFTNI